jgi:4-amino-4-deoxy-L-arabinose transferase-like glycosyltransferase
VTRREALALVGVLVVAALLRLPGLESRGQFDADQGHDMRTLAAFTREGVVPLLGPKTSVGEFHHGAFYYFLLAPAAALSNDDPVAVTGWLALLGIGAVALTWWLARSIASRMRGATVGSVAGLIAGVLLAVSPAAIDESTFIWNPNAIAFFAMLSLAAAWRAHTGGRRGWWALAIGAAGAVMELHVLGIVFLVAVAALGVLELRRDRGIAPALLGGAAIVVLLLVPLAVWDLHNDFSETRAMVAYLTGDRGSVGGGPIGAIAFTLLRVVGWPLVHLVTDVPQLAAVMVAVTVALVAWGLRMSRGDSASGYAWLVGLLVWSVLALAFAAPSLQTVVAGLPNDHYHAFVDPVVVMLIAIPAADLLVGAFGRWRDSRSPSWFAATAALATGLGLIVAVEIARMPPWLDPNGGWAKARDAGVRVVASAQGAPVTLFGLPDFKLPDAIGFPIEHAGGTLAVHVDLMGFPEGTDLIAIACDRLFEGPIGAACAGPAEDAYLRSLPEIQGGTVALRLIDRFDASPRTSVSVYVPVAGP